MISAFSFLFSSEKQQACQFVRFKLFFTKI